MIAATDPIAPVLSAYGWQAADCKVSSLGGGLINHTWQVDTRAGRFVLQRINHTVFTEPAVIDDNLRCLHEYVQATAPDYRLPFPVAATDGRTLVHIPEAGYYRVLPFVPDTHTIDVVSDAGLAYAAARQFAGFTKVLTGFDVTQLRPSIPHFHHLRLRFNQFEQACKQGNPDRIREAAELIRQLQGGYALVEQFDAFVRDPACRQRVMHHDTKISNVLFDSADQAVCVIDLDTVMPGYFFSDIGDMFRTYSCPVSEEESDFSKIMVRADICAAIETAYLEGMNDALTPTERTHLLYSGECLIYMQAIRFLTDFLNDDVYYGARYPGHNLVRAGNQAVLLEQFQAYRKSR